MNKIIEVQGHRGCRGLMPENTIPAFTKALELGVTTLEMDLVISKDKKVVVSHEPYFSHEISIDPTGDIISKENERSHNLYAMTMEEISRYDVGLKPHPRFPDQEKIPVSKPLFSEVVRIAEHFSEENDLMLPHYNVEIKRNPIWDTIFHPGPKEFADLVVEAVRASGVKDRLTIQSFDVESLQIVRAIDPTIKLVLLVENNDGHIWNIQRLGFTPEIYCPEYNLMTPDLVEYCQLNKIQLIPWTVNSEKDMKQMIGLGVDGIITDYPDLLITLLNELKISVR